MTESEAKVYFKNMKGFPALNENDEIVTEEFLLASREIVSALESFGTIFTPIVYDMGGNIQRLEKYYQENTEEYYHLENILVPKTSDSKPYTLGALLWLKRALELIAAFFKNIVDDEECTEDLREPLRNAYEATLKPYHGWIVQKAFSVIYRLIPRRSTLLGKGDTHRENVEHLERFLPPMEICLRQINILLESNSLDNNSTA